MTVDAPKTSSANNSGDLQLYAQAKKVYPQSVKGRFRNFKWAFMIFALGIYYFPALCPVGSRPQCA